MLGALPFPMDNFFGSRINFYGVRNTRKSDQCTDQHRIDASNQGFATDAKPLQLVGIFCLRLCDASNFPGVHQALKDLCVCRVPDALRKIRSEEDRFYVERIWRRQLDLAGGRLK